MKAKGEGGGSSPGPAMEGKQEEEEGATRACKNCRRPVAAPNLALHEAHCLRFLAVCPECEEPVARREMEGHLAGAHRQVRCPLCHQAMQQFQLEHHQAELCPERPCACAFCELGLPFRRLGPHLEACGSRTQRCWDCGRYVMFRALEAHVRECPGGHGAETQTVLCQQCQRRIPREEHLQHLDQCCPLPHLLGALSTSGPPKEEEEGARPKRKDKEPPALLRGRPSFKPPRSRRAVAPAAPPSPAPQGGEDAYDRLDSCSRCNILLPGPTLKKHQRKCQGQALRRSPRFSGTEEAQSPPGEKSWQ